MPGGTWLWEGGVRADPVQTPHPQHLPSCQIGADQLVPRRQLAVPWHLHGGSNGWACAHDAAHILLPGERGHL